MIEVGRKSLLLIIALLFQLSASWIIVPNKKNFNFFFRFIDTAKIKPTATNLDLASTPFEADFYENPYDDGSENNNLRDSSSLAVPPNTKLVVGLNKYSHDTSICAADVDTGKVLFAQSKERITRRKHDSGNVASLVDTCLAALNLDLDSIDLVVQNNHHHRIAPLEQNIRHMEWESGLNINGGAEEAGYDDPENLLPDATSRHELSHHLAHAYSTATQAPFETGLVVVMDGMGETYRTMMHAKETGDKHYTSDFSFKDQSFECIPSNLAELAAQSHFDWREAESIYVFAKKTDTKTIDLRPVWKRFTQENSPPVLYNHGFENMDSVGAVYSRAASHIFGNWNVCGKVMGLAPWAHYHRWTDEHGNELRPQLHDSGDSKTILSGSLYSEQKGERFTIDRTLLEGMPLIARNDPDLFEETTNDDGTISLTRKKRYDFDDADSDEPDDEETNTAGKRIPVQVALDAIAVADRVQIDTETVILDLVQHFKKQTGEKNLCLAGGVALNSVLNGKLARDIGFEQTFISPYPGDDGIAVGCCAFGLFGNACLDKENDNEGNNKVPVIGSLAPKERPPIWNTPLSPYLGPSYSEWEIKMAIDKAEPWLEVDVVRNEDTRLKLMAEEIESGGVVAWYQGRSEMGPRALGHRSILADPRKKGLVRFINEKVKSRESFRPFAPSVLVEEAANWFDLGEIKERADNKKSNNDAANVSPFMSMTAMVKPHKRALIPAVTHVDGSSRLQTVTRESEPVYHKLIRKFFELNDDTPPMVLNTSFNTLPGEPIVETPSDAIRSFLYSMGSLEMLVIGDYMIKRKEPDLRKLLGEVTKDDDVIVKEPVSPVRAGRAYFQSSFDVDTGPMNEENVQTLTKVRMPDRPMHADGGKNEWFELIDELEGELLSICDGTVTLNDIMAHFTASPEDLQFGKEEVDDAQTILQNVVHRLVRLYEHTLISW